MRGLRAALAAAGLLAALSPMPAAAEKPALTLEEAVAHALAHNPELAAARARLAAAGEASAAAEAARLPEINLRYTARRSDNPLDAFADRLNTRSVTSADFDPARLNDPGASTLHATALSVTWPLYTGGRLEAGARAAASHARAARHRYQRLRETVAYQTRAAYLEAQAAEAAVQILDEAVRAMQGHADTTARLLAERRIVASDKLSADVSLALTEGQREQAVTRARRARERLALVMGLAPGEPLPVLPPWKEPDKTPMALDVLARNSEGVLEQVAIERRADLQALAAEHEAARAAIDAARAAFRPQLSVGAARHWYDDSPGLDNASNSLFGTVSMNLWRGGRDHHELERAAKEAEAAAARLAAARLAAADEVRAAVSALVEARARVAICADNVGKARRAVEIVRRRYGEGRTLLLDLLQAERVLTESRLEKLHASLAVALGEAGLDYATGTLLSATEEEGRP
jgi:outer membrane protein TolC